MKKKIFLLLTSFALIIGLSFFTFSCIDDIVTKTESGGHTPPPPAPPPVISDIKLQATVEDLKNFEVPASAIAPNVAILQYGTRGAIITNVTEQSNAVIGRYIEITGQIKPQTDTSNGRTTENIRFMAALPETWNGKAVQLGGSGFSGSVSSSNITGTAPLSVQRPLDMGFLVYMDNSGHQGAVNDARFALNNEMLLNWAHEHIIKSRDTIVAIAKKAYDAEPRLHYYLGNSTGGREALSAATRYGEYFDGVVSVNPAANFILLRLWGAIVSSNVYKGWNVNGPITDGSFTGAGFIDDDTVRNIARACVAKFDRLDNASDSVVSNIWAARAQSAAWMDQIAVDFSLSADQKETLNICENGYVLEYNLKNGFNKYPGYAAMQGTIMNLGSSGWPREPVAADLNVAQGLWADQAFKYIIMQDPAYRLLSQPDYRNPSPNVIQRLQWASENIDSNGPDFDKFIQRGGKAIISQGWHDDTVSPFATIQMYENYVKVLGQSRVDSFLKFYLTPGMTHSGGGTWDCLSALDEWVETGVFPNKTFYLTRPGTNGTRPMCQYPMWPEFIGSNIRDGADYRIAPKP